MNSDLSLLNPIAIMEQGGLLMWPILICSIVAIAVVIERFIALRRATIDTQAFMETMRQVLRQNRIQDALTICEETDAPIARIMKAGILKHNKTREEIREAIEDAGSFEVPRLEQHLNILGTCATVAPLLGLLGTVQGMILAFAQIQHKQGQVVPADLAQGIGNALLTTAFGLSVAIPTLIFYNYFVSRVNSMVAEMELSSSELLELLTHHRGEREI